MMIRFFAHGDGSGTAVVKYLLAAEVAAFDADRNRIKGQVVKREVLPEVLAGHAPTTQILIDSNHRKWRYTSGVIAFADDDAPSEVEQREVMAGFEQAAFAGMEVDQTDILWVRHTHMGNVELHFLVPRVELAKGRAFNIAPPGAEKYFNAFRDYWNALKGWADPNALEKRRDMRAVVESKDRSENRELINTRVLQEIENGSITDHLSMRKYLSNLQHLGLEIKPLSEKQTARRAKQDAIEIETNGEKKRRRDTRITLREIGTTGTDTTYRLEGRIYHEEWTSDEYFAAKTAEGSGSKREGKSGADRQRIEEFRSAMHKAIDRRAQSNRERYQRSAQGSAGVEPANGAGASGGGGCVDQANSYHDDGSAISGDEGRGVNGGDHDGGSGNVPFGRHDRLDDPREARTATGNAANPNDIGSKPNHEGHRRAWHRGAPAQNAEVTSCPLTAPRHRICIKQP